MFVVLEERLFQLCVTHGCAAWEIQSLYRRKVTVVQLCSASGSWDRHRPLNGCDGKV